MPGKEDVVRVTDLPDFSSILGCLAPDDNFIHLGSVLSKITACGKSVGDVILSKDVTVNCPECVAELRYRGEHPAVAGEAMGVVTHKL